MRRSMIRGLSLTITVSSLIAVQAVPFFTNQSQSTTGNSSIQTSNDHVTILATETVTAALCAHSKNPTEGHDSGAPVPEPVQQSKPTQPALVPAVHWNTNTGDLKALTPTVNQSLYYSAGGVGDPSIEHVFALVSTNISYSSVVLEHSAYIQSVVCESNALRITFNDATASAYAASAWSSTSPLVLVTFTAGCGSSTQQRSFHLVNKIQSRGGGKAIDVAIQQELSIEEAMPEVEVVWGTYKPSVDSLSSTSSTTNGGISGSGGSDSGSSGLGSSRSSSPVSSVLPPGISGSPSLAGPGNHTSGSPAMSTDGICGAPPSLIIDGFYTATCGSSTFDHDIDAEIGYLDFSGTSDFAASLQDFAPGLSDDGDDYQASDNDDFGSPRRRHRSRLRRRKWFSSLGKVFSKVGQAFVAAGQGIVNGGIKVLHALSDAVAINPMASADIPINVGPKNLVDSPFGPALQLYSKEKDSKSGAATGNIALYCVDCGVHGSVHLKGQARWTIADGLTQANAGLNGDIAAGLQLGIDANAAFQDTLTYPIISVYAPPGFSIPGIFSIGPEVSLAAEIGLSITLAGQLLAGVKMTIPNFSANIDLVDGSKSASSGFTPQFEKIFQAKAAISARAALGLPLGIGLGVQIPAIKFSKTAAIYDKPSIEAMMTYSGSTTNEGINGNTDCLNGIKYALEFGNDIYVDLFGKQKFDIFNFTIPIASDCISLGAQTNTAGASSSTPDTAAPSSPTPKTIANSSTTESTTLPPAEDGAPAESFSSTAATGSPKNDSALDRRGLKANHELTLGSSKRSTPKRDDPFEYVEDGDEDAPADNSQFDTLSEEALADASNETSAASATGVGADPDSSFLYISDLSNTYALQADPVSGNIYISEPGDGSLFAATSGYVVGDIDGRYLHFHPNLMKAYNVSRFRLSGENSTPKDADFVALVPVDHDSDATTPDIYAAFDTTGGGYVTISCDYETEASKVFLAADPVQGVKTLQDPKLRYTVTGGLVTNCYYLPWAVPSSAS